MGRDRKGAPPVNTEPWGDDTPRDSDHVGTTGTSHILFGPGVFPGHSSPAPGLMGIGAPPARWSA